MTASEKAMAAIIHQMLYKLISILISIGMLFGIPGGSIKVDRSNWNTDYKFVFVHGLLGWGSYDMVNDAMPYWGMGGGDLMEYLNDKGFDCYAASVSGNGSAWDRACELYAQLTGSVVDYGKEHSERCNHKRFGTDYTGKALIDSWSEKDKINLLGHSFGGATVRLFASILETGSEAEKTVTDKSELSDFFQGGKGDWIYSVTTLAAPHNGTTAYSVDQSDLTEYTNNDDPQIKQLYQRAFTRLIWAATGMKVDKRIESDYANFDMNIDNALTMNKEITTLKNTYYFSVPCSASTKDSNGNYIPDETKMESMFVLPSTAIGRYTGTTDNGFVIDENWKENDGLVNTISAKAPFGAPATVYDKNNVNTGEWNIMPTYDGDHMSLQGGMTKVNDIKDFYVDMLMMINCL